VIPIRASQDSTLAAGAEHAAPSKTLQRFNVEQTQPAAKRAIGNVASDIRSADISGQTLASKASDLAERAQQIKDQSKPVFEKLDQLTAGEDMKFSDWQQQERAAWRRGDIEAAQKAKAEQEKLLTKYASQFAPDDLQNARTNWRQASNLEKVHDRLNTKAIVQPTPVAFRPEGVPDPGVINGRNFSKAVLAMSNDGTLADAGLTSQHIQSLQDLGTLLENSANVRKLSKLAIGLTGGGGAFGIATHTLAAARDAAAAGGATAPSYGVTLGQAGATAAAGYATSQVLGKIMTNPKWASWAVDFLKGAARVAPGTAFQIGQSLRLRDGRNVTVTDIYRDGSFDAH
jgi:hypothetical protein